MYTFYAIRDIVYKIRFDRKQSCKLQNYNAFHRRKQIVSCGL